ncbi:hypothetical protein QYM36_011744 [Artemia franciscana]|uniref:Protein Abitram n=1 Tax=Artemia franciscana TaxID=6661 RepID=A0AA88HJR4_ARTSF|nr:hypothetical protein QYM36_011744 [Artemia franciscana]
MDSSSVVTCDIADSVDLNIPFQTVTERYYTPFYFCGKDHEDFRALQHSNKLFVITLAPTHSILKGKKTVTKVDFDVGPNSNRLENVVSGKGKRGAQFLMPDSLLCFIETSDGERYEVRSCVKGKLVEVNSLLVTNPSLITSHPDSKGYIAIIICPLSAKNKEYEHLMNEKDYQKYSSELNNVQ